MFAKIVALTGALMLLAACSSAPKPPPPVPGYVPSETGGASSSSYAPGSQQDLAATAGDRVFFAFNSATISAEAQQILGRQAAWLQRYPNVSITISGNCDPRGTREYNLALGARRAEAAKDVLVASGVAASRIQTISYGKERPTEPGDSEEAYAQDRNAITNVN